MPYINAYSNINQLAISFFPAPQFQTKAGEMFIHCGDFDEGWL